MSRYFAFAITALLLALEATAQRYQLLDNYTEANFFDNFDFISSPDPSHGLVNYAAAHTANNQRLAGFYSDSIYLGADHLNKVGFDGRPSVRVESKKTYNHGLFVGDFSHMPEGCGTWPAFWTYGTNPRWPDAGEIDIIEGVHIQGTNKMTLHTGSGCIMAKEGTLENTLEASLNCNEGMGYIGCRQEGGDMSGYGSGFNDNGGGVYAMEWTSEHIAVWFFPRNSIPPGILDTDSPEIASFGIPTAKFVGEDGCNIDEHFKNHVIVINLTMCGDWAGNVWDQFPTCTAKASTCNDYVMNNPKAFTDAYWLVNSVRTYRKIDETRRSRIFGSVMS